MEEPTSLRFDINDIKALATANGSASSIGDTLSGMSFRLLQPSLPKHQDRMGIAFFTRPMLRLDLYNLIRDRRLMEYMTKVPQSIQRWAKCTLDPRLMTNYLYPGGNTTHRKEAITCPLVNNELPFIPILSNQLMKLSGWPDPVIDTYKSPEGIYKEVFIGVDGLYDINNNYTLNLTFKNSKLNPIYKLFNLWTLYMSKVRSGELLPYEDFAIYNVLDYTTCVYVLILDDTGESVIGTAKTGYAIPVTSAMGARYDVDTSKPYNNNTDEINIALDCVNAVYDDPYTLRAFNKTVELSAVCMREKYRNTYMIKIPRSALQYFKNMGLPRINTADGNKLETWVPRGLAKMHLEKVNNFRKAIGEPAITIDGINSNTKISLNTKGFLDLSNGNTIIDNAKTNLDKINREISGITDISNNIDTAAKQLSDVANKTDNWFSNTRGAIDKYDLTDT